MYHVGVLPSGPGAHVGVGVPERLFAGSFRAGKASSRACCVTCAALGGLAVSALLHVECIMTVARTTMLL